MKTFIRLVTVLALLPISNLASAKDLDSFPGKYRVTINTWSGAEQTEFLLNSKGELKLLLDEWEESSIQSAAFSLMKEPELMGPDLPVGVLSFGLGSDEDGVSAYAHLAWIGEMGSQEIKLINSFFVYYDGPNEVTDFQADAVELEKWDKKTKSYQKL